MVRRRASPDTIETTDQPPLARPGRNRTSCPLQYTDLRSEAERQRLITKSGTARSMISAETTKTREEEIRSWREDALRLSRLTRMMRRIAVSCYVVDWELVRGWTEALGSGVTALVAVFALFSWKTQLRAGAQHAAAAEIAEAAELTRYHFFDARNPFHGMAEFPDWYLKQQQHTDADNAKAYAHLYEKRWKLLEVHMLRLATLRAKARAILGDDTAIKLEELAKKTRELHNFFQEHVKQLKAGEHIVAQWPDQGWVKKVKASITASPQEEHRDDVYSVEFEQKFKALNGVLTPHLSV